MWIEETKNGKFKFVERYTDYITGKQKKISVTLDKNTPKNRKLALDMLKDKMKSEEPKSDKGLTLKELIDKYRIYQQKTVKQSTYQRNYHASNTIMNILGEETLVNRLSASYVTDCMLNTGKEPGTLNEHLTRFKAIIRWGYQNDYIENISFLDKIVRFKDISKREKIKDKYLETNEVKKLLQQIKKTNCWHWYHLTRFLILSGLRSGEAIALTNSDVDLENRVIYVNKTYDAVNKIVTSPKTSCSIREVYIQDELLKCIYLLKEYVNNRKLIYNQDNDLFLTNNMGKRIDYYSYDKFLKENAKLIEIKKITPHTLRHTHASLLLAEGISVDAISRRLGHENSRVTKEIYLHITEKLKKKDNETLKQIKIM